ncbi:MAG: hypothetical protein LBT59_09280 [Clostridiales bacterium]|nr:hypothetical protein [Clostridiales bacterium]
MKNILESAASENPSQPGLQVNLSIQKITDALREQGFKISLPTVGIYLDELGYARKKNKRNSPGKKKLSSSLEDNDD